MCARSGRTIISIYIFLRARLANEIVYAAAILNEERKGKRALVPFKFIPAERKRRNLLARSLVFLLALQAWQDFLALRRFCPSSITQVAPVSLDNSLDESPLEGITKKTKKSQRRAQNHEAELRGKFQNR